MISEQLKDEYIFVYKQAKIFLSNLIGKHFSDPTSILNRYIYDKSPYDNLSDANKRLIASMSNRGMMLSVIGFDKKEPKMKELLCDYDPGKILGKY